MPRPLHYILNRPISGHFSEMSEPEFQHTNSRMKEWGWSPREKKAKSTLPSNPHYIIPYPVPRYSSDESESK